MIAFQFPAGKVKAALCFAGVKDIRYYLNGVYFTNAPDGKGVIAVATDGARLAVVYHAQDMRQIPAFAVIVPSAQLLLAARSPAKSSQVEMDLVFQMKDALTVTIKGASTVECLVVDGKYPDWQKIIPQPNEVVGVNKYPADAFGLNAEYLGDYAKAFKALGGRGHPVIRIDQATDGRAMLVCLSGQPDFVSVLMGAREFAPTLPKWLAVKAGPAAAFIAAHPEIAASNDYAQRVAALEAEGLTTSDAQAVIDAEEMTKAA